MSRPSKVERVPSMRSPTPGANPSVKRTRSGKPLTSNYKVFPVCQAASVLSGPRQRFTLRCSS
jgi:hypothetical protein